MGKRVDVPGVQGSLMGRARRGEGMLRHSHGNLDDGERLRRLRRIQGVLHQLSHGCVEALPRLLCNQPRGGMVRSGHAEVGKRVAGIEGGRNQERERIARKRTAGKVGRGRSRCQSRRCFCSRQRTLLGSSAEACSPRLLPFWVPCWSVVQSPGVLLRYWGGCVAVVSQPRSTFHVRCPSQSLADRVLRTSAWTIFRVETAPSPY